MLNNRFMLLGLGVVVLKQLFLGISTYYIALAGKYVVADDMNKTIWALVLFFMFALLAYMVHSVNKFLLLQSKRLMFANYLSKFFDNIKDKQNFNHSQAKQQSVAWFSGEAKNTLSNTVDFISQSLDLYLNVIITFLVFYYTIGAKISLIIFLAFVLSLLLVFLTKNYIKKLASEQQDHHWQLNQYFSVHWDYAIFSNPVFFEKSKQDINAKVQKYYHSETKYIVIEQLIAIVPILICVLFLVIYLLGYDNNIEQLAMMVAILPRTLQLLGSVHSLSANNAQMAFIKTQYKKVVQYQPTSVDFIGHIKKDNIIINDLLSKMHYHVDEFIGYIDNFKNQQKSGRFLVVGDNGAGKSSLLKHIKSKLPNAILVSPESHFHYDTNGLSTGQAQFNKLMDFLSVLTCDKTTCDVLLLDEWDANFDKSNRQKIDDKLNQLSRHLLVIEVRHRQ